MVWSRHEYDAIPGTYVFNGKTAHSAFALNKLLFSFNSAANRAEFAADRSAYADKHGLTVDQKNALLTEDFLGLLRLGANIYYLAKLAVPLGFTVQDAGAAFQGISTEQFKAALRAKGEGLVEKLHRQGGYWDG